MYGFIEKIETRTAVIGIIGQGYVGLPLGAPALGGQWSPRPRLVKA